MTQNIISFDVGIKNLAFCLLEVNAAAGEVDVKQWGIINLITETPNYCNHCKDKGKYRLAKWRKQDVLYCQTHGKQSDWKVPDSQWLRLEKLKNVELQALADTVSTTRPSMPKKSDVFAYLDEHRKNTYLDTIHVPKAKDVDIVVLGKALMERLDKILSGEKVDIVLVENQIGTIALRMKTLQGMLYQYFIMRYVNCEVVTVSSSNKLKLKDDLHDPMAPTSYAERKKQAVILAKTALLQLLPSSHLQWIQLLESSKKKDDLADSLLQGLWYLKERLKVSHTMFDNS